MWTWSGSRGGSRWPPKRRRRQHAGGQRGFTLLEVLVAFTVLAIMMTVLLRIFSDGFRGMTAADAHTLATLHAQSALASVGGEIPLTPGDWTGVHDDGFRWRVEIEPYEELGMIVPPRAFVAYRIMVVVEGQRTGSATLSSLRLAGAGLDPSEGEVDDPR